MITALTTLQYSRDAGCTGLEGTCVLAKPGFLNGTYIVPVNLNSSWVSYVTFVYLLLIIY